MNNKKEIISTELYNNDKIKQIEEYWTLERLQNAAPILPPSTTPEKQTNIDENEKQILPIPPNKPNKEGKEMELLGTPFPVDITKYPYECFGKIYFTDTEGVDRYGTAEFAGNGNILLTAAHCLRDSNSGKFFKNFLFIRAYKNGAGQRFAIDYVGTFNGWIGGNRAYDYGFCHTVLSYPYWLGVQEPTSYQYLQAVGYPENFGSGEVLYAANGKKGRINSGTLQMLGNPMRHGNSGGAWIGCTREGEVSDYAVGINSFHYDSETDNEYSPLFIQGNINRLFQCVLNKNC